MHQERRWHWGSFIAFGVGCFVIGTCTGVLAVPGILPVVLGAIAGACAARWQWLEPWTLVQDGQPPGGQE